MAFIFNPNKKRGVFMIPSGATKSPTPTPPSFINNYSLSMDGVDDFLDTGAIDLGETNTISFWFKNNSANTGNAIIGDANDNVVYFQSSNLFYYPTGSITGRKLFSSTNIASAMSDTTNWHNLIFIRKAPTNGTNGYNDLACYLDGNLEGTFADVYTANINLIPVYIGKSGTGFPLYDGLIDEVSYYDNDQTENVSTISTSPVVDLTSLNPVAWYRNGDNGTFKSPQWLIPNNENKTKFSNYSFEYDGVDDKVELSSQSFNITATISVSAWVKIPTTNTGGASPFIQIIVGEDTKAGTNRNWALFWRGGTTLNGFSAFIYDSSGAYVTVNSALPTPNDNNWHHLMFTYTGDTSTDGLKLFVDGVQIAQATSSNSGLRASTSVIPTIGGVSNTIQRMFEGNIDEVSIFNSVQDASTIYNSGVPTDISSLSPVGYWRSEQSNFTDNWLVDNSALSNYSTRSFAFDGISDYINTGASTLIGETALSISAWVYPTAYGDATAPSFVSTDAASPRAFYLGLFNGTNFRFSLSTNGTSLTSLDTASSTVTLNAWQHILVTWDQVNLKLYKNGVLLKTVATTSSSNGTFTTANDLLIGARRSSAGFFEGNIDEVAIWNSVQDASTIYNSGTPARIEGATSHWRMGEDATFNTNWNVPDNGSASNTGTSANMTIADLEGNAPNYTGGGLSNNMTIEDRVGDAPNSTSNALSYNMDEVDRETDVPT